jgi:hypothetical protein
MSFLGAVPLGGGVANGGITTTSAAALGLLILSFQRAVAHVNADHSQPGPARPSLRGEDVIGSDKDAVDVHTPSRAAPLPLRDPVSIAGEAIYAAFMRNSDDLLTPISNTQMAVTTVLAATVAGMAFATGSGMIGVFFSSPTSMIGLTSGSIASGSTAAGIAALHHIHRSLTNLYYGEALGTTESERVKKQSAVVFNRAYQMCRDEASLTALANNHGLWGRYFARLGGPDPGLMPVAVTYGNHSSLVPFGPLGLSQGPRNSEMSMESIMLDAPIYTAAYLADHIICSTAAHTHVLHRKISKKRAESNLTTSWFQNAAFIGGVVSDASTGLVRLSTMQASFIRHVSEDNSTTGVLSAIQVLAEQLWDLMSWAIADSSLVATFLLASAFFVEVSFCVKIMGSTVSAMQIIYSTGKSIATAPFRLRLKMHGGSSIKPPLIGADGTRVPSVFFSEFYPQAVELFEYARQPKKAGSPDGPGGPGATKSEMVEHIKLGLVQAYQDGRLSREGKGTVGETTTHMLQRAKKMTPKEAVRILEASETRNTSAFYRANRKELDKTIDAFHYTRRPAHSVPPTAGSAATAFHVFAMMAAAASV